MKVPKVKRWLALTNWDADDAELREFMRRYFGRLAVGAFRRAGRGVVVVVVSDDGRNVDDAGYRSRDILANQGAPASMLGLVDAYAPTRESVLMFLNTRGDFLDAAVIPVIAIQ